MDGFHPAVFDLRRGEVSEMSIRMQCCGIVVLSILIFFQIRQRRTRLTTERVFRWVLGTGLVNLLLDVGSVTVINYALNTGHPMPRFVVDLVCKLYLMTLPAMGLSALLYICADMEYAHPKRMHKKGMIYGAMTLVSMLVILALPIEYHRNLIGQVVNTDGPSVYATYGAITIHLTLIIYHLFRDRARMNRRRRTAVLVWMSLWLGSFAAQLMDNSLLLAGFSGAAGTLIIYLSMENPEGNLDRQTGLFREDVLKSYLRQLYSWNKDFSVAVLVFDQGQKLRRGVENTERVRLELMRYLDSKKKWMVFKENDERTYLIFNTPEEAQEAIKRVNTYLVKHRQNTDTLPVKVRWIFVPSAQEANGQDDLLSLIDAVSRKHAYTSELVTVDARLIEDVRRDREIERLLATAMAEDRVEVFYQPIYSISQRRVTGAEALVRIRDEEGNLVSPALFIPIAESNGMILRLGKIVFEKVCIFIKSHPLRELGLSQIHVNLSMVQCACTDLAMDYIDIMRRYGIDPQQINLEITESASTDEKALLLVNMDKLIDYGVSFALDDFGMGQSNLNYIMDMPVKKAKFDREMTQAYFTNTKARHVMIAAVRMIHDMGLMIVSEGVETAEECRAIEELGIEYIQGYYFSKPLPEEAFLDYVKNFQPPALSYT